MKRSKNHKKLRNRDKPHYCISPFTWSENGTYEKFINGLYSDVCLASEINRYKGR